MCLFFTIKKVQPISLLWLRDSEVRMAVALRISLLKKSNFAKISKEINILSESPWTRFWYFWQQHVLFKFALTMLNTDYNAHLWRWSPVYESVEDGQQWERENVHEDQVEPSHINLEIYMNFIINSTKFWHFLMIFLEWKQKNLKIISQ